jgi:hypothetical protein
MMMIMVPSSELEIFRKCTLGSTTTERRPKNVDPTGVRSYGRVVDANEL